jgi:hypothetical protein
MAVTASVFNLWKKGQLNGSHFVDFDTDTLKVSLHTASWTPNLLTNEFFTDATNELSTAGGYTAGGKTLTTPVVGTDASGFAYFIADPVTWTALTATFRYAVLRKDTGVAGTSPIIEVIDFGTNQSPAGVDFVLAWAAAGSGGILKAA